MWISSVAEVRTHVPRGTACDGPRPPTRAGYDSAPDGRGRQALPAIPRRPGQGQGPSRQGQASRGQARDGAPRAAKAAALGTLATVLLYLIAQMVGAGGLIRLMFGIPYEQAVVVVGVAFDVTTEM